MLIPLYPDQKIAIWLSFPSDSFTSKILKHLKTSNRSIGSYRLPCFNSFDGFTPVNSIAFGTTMWDQTQGVYEHFDGGAGYWSPRGSWSIWKWELPKWPLLIYSLCIQVSAYRKSLGYDLGGLSPFSDSVWIRNWKWWWWWWFTCGWGCHSFRMFQTSLPCKCPNQHVGSWKKKRLVHCSGCSHWNSIGARPKVCFLVGGFKQFVCDIYIYGIYGNMG